ncbi:hypothetical protein K438DRAFT_2023020 [Mycena galopus ATCC 62051]|nr:hypothetical protein K438DRAFT_2023020 [Mycena galopus ATCC 62051]
MGGGMVRGDSGVLSCAERLEMLRDHRRAWRSLEWKARTVLEIGPLITRRPHYDLSGGVFAEVQGQDLLVTSLSRIVDDAENATVSHRIGIDSSDFQDFSIDPTQNLVVFSYLAPGGVAHWELRTISTNQPHPLATQPVLSFPQCEAEATATQIADDVIAMGLNVNGAYVVLLNWRTGRIFALVSLQDLEFLSPRSYILVHSGDDTYPMGRIEIYTFDGTHSPTLTATLLLPALLPDQRIFSVRTQAGPFCSNPIPGMPFSKSNENRIYMLSIVYSDTSCSHLFIRHRFLYKYVSEYKDTTPAMVVPWEEWGPQSSRLLPGRHAEWMEPHGERFAFACNNLNVVKVLDFRVNTGRADMLVDPTPAAGFNSVFQNPVITTLPYRSLWRVLEEESDRFLLDQDRLFSISLCGNLKSKMTVYTF